jgi:uracil-DNA glycosylase family 4
LELQEKQEALSQLAAEIIDDNVCPELAKSAKQLVMGDGNVNTDIVLIGEAPGKNEDEQGIPFVGAAGKFLNEMLAEAGMERGDIYITNVVKYRPPNNRDPLPEEKDEFAPYLDKQLEIIQPKVVATLGRHSMEYFLPGLKISEAHGRAFRKNVSWMSDLEASESDATQGGRSVVFLPLYHPAAALYNGGLRETLIEDFKKLPAILTKI